MMNKVELCGVNTSKLPLLREDEKEELFVGFRKAMKKREKNILKEICDWF